MRRRTDGAGQRTGWAGKCRRARIVAVGRTWRRSVRITEPARARTQTSTWSPRATMAARRRTQRRSRRSGRSRSATGSAFKLGFLISRTFVSTKPATLRHSAPKIVVDLVRQLSRYSPEAFEFLREGLDYTVRRKHGPAVEKLRQVLEWLQESELDLADLSEAFD